MDKAKKHIEPPKLTVQHRAGTNQKVLLSHSSLDWYKLTESTRHVLNTVITNNAKKLIEERSKTNPDQNKISELKAFSLKVVELTRDAKNFESKNRMQEILTEYGQIDMV